MSVKATRLQTKALSAFESAHSDLLEAARLQAEEADAKRTQAVALNGAAGVLEAEASKNAARAADLGALLRL